MSPAGTAEVLTQALKAGQFKAKVRRRKDPENEKVAGKETR
jgi:hypothetical protein